MSAIVKDEIPVRDERRTSQMVDDLDTESAASSDISESLRDLILGIQRPRRAKRVPEKSASKIDSKKTASQESSYVVVPSKEDFEVVYDKKSSGDTQNLSPHSSYHTSESQSSMKAADDRRYTTIETQTVAIQTTTAATDSELDCKCTWGDQYECGCQECHCRDYRYSSQSAQSRTVSEETTDVPNFENYTDSSNHEVREKRRSRFRCTCNNCNGYESYESASDPVSDSDDSYTTDFLDLPYQNNEEYLKLLRELEKKLVARNRDRVRKTRMEFEKRSRMNQNLERPISDYSDDSASMLRKLSGSNGNHKSRSGCCKCCRCGRKRVNSDIMQNEKRWDEMSLSPTPTPSPSPSVEAPEDNPPPSQHRIERSLHKSHWRLDPRSGEWVKVSCFQQTDFSRPPPGDHFRDDYKKPHNGNGHKKECCCRKKRGLM